RWLIATIVFGIVLAGVQVVRGTHYVSHSLWTAWWCWAFTLVSLHAVMRGGRSAAAHWRRSGASGSASDQPREANGG
ncbi:MAG TPA: phosphatidic acid phosphatase, partial [Caldimonas sp.]